MVNTWLLWLILALAAVGWWRVIAAIGDAIGWAIDRAWHREHDALNLGDLDRRDGRRTR